MQISTFFKICRELLFIADIGLCLHLHIVCAHIKKTQIFQYVSLAFFRQMLKNLFEQWLKLLLLFFGNTTDIQAFKQGCYFFFYRVIYFRLDGSLRALADTYLFYLVVYYSSYGLFLKTNSSLIIETCEQIATQPALSVSNHCS